MQQNNFLKKYLHYFSDSSILAAIESSKFVGSGDKKNSDEAATKIMRNFLNSCEFFGIVRIGEGEMDEASMLFRDEKLGFLRDSERILDEQILDIAVDPLEGTNLCANGNEGSLTTICFSFKDSILRCPDIYMEKIIVSNGHANSVCLNNSFEENLKNLAESSSKKLTDLKIIMLNRERHREQINLARKLGVKVLLISDGDIGASINVLLGSADMYYGIGGAPEGVLSAACAKSFNGGEFFGKLIIRNENEAKKANECGILDFEKIYKANDLIKGDCFFIATAVTDNEFLKGVKFFSKYIEIETMIFSSYEKSYYILKSFKDIKNYES